MVRQSNQKMRILLEQTDEQHPMTLQEIMDALDKYSF